MTEIVPAGPADTDVLSGIIAEAFHALPPSPWLISDDAARRRIFPGYFAIFVGYALAGGMVYTTADRAAVALWFPVGDEPPEPPDGYPAQLKAATGEWTSRFAAFDEALDSHHPAGCPHHHLAMMAVRPGRQGRGIGSALLAAHHKALDDTGTPAYLEASSERSRALYLRHGYLMMRGGPYRLPGGGPPMWPMWREPGNRESHRN